MANNDDNDMIICRCEEVTRGEILEAIDAGCHTIDEVKRATRAGMGPCQGRTCSRLIARLLSEKTRIPANEFKPMTVQFPVRPVLLSTIAASRILEEE